MTLTGRYDIKSELSLFGDLLYSDRDSENSQAAAPIANSHLIETWTGFPYVPIDHPANPFGTDGELRSRAQDVGSRDYSVESTAWRFVAGLEGLLGNWDWLATLFLAQNDVTNTGRNEISRTRYQQALLGMGGPNGDMYYNPFGEQPQNSAEVKNWISATHLGKHESKASGLEFEVNGFFGALAGGPVGMAAGAEFRKNELDQWWDEQTMSDDLAGFGVLVPVSADRSVASAYIEFSLPLHETFEAQLAARYDHYDDFGSTTNPKVALRWQPIPSLMFRGSYSTSFSPPSFNELFDPVAMELQWYIDTVRCEYTGLEEDCSWWEYPSQYSGNPNLDPEELSLIHI